MKFIATTLFCLFSFAVFGQEVNSYRLSVKIDEKQNKLYVDGFLDIDFKGKDSITFLLWKNTVIDDVSIDGVILNYKFDKDSVKQSLFVPNARSLLVVRNNKSNEMQSVHISYNSTIINLISWEGAFSEEWIELAMYCAWYPLNLNNSNYTADLKVYLDDNYILTGSGITKKIEGYWEFKKPWKSFDIVLIASKEIKTKVLNNGTNHIMVEYKNLSEQASDSVLNECDFAYSYFEKIFGKKDSCNLKFVLGPFRQGAGFSRKYFISVPSDNFDFYTRSVIIHEIAHFWWLNANPDTWEDWLNEGFAQYSALLIIRERLGKEIFLKQIEDYRQEIQNTPPIMNIERNHPQSYKVLYLKGALILYDLEQNIGTKQFNSLMHEISIKKVKTTDELLQTVANNVSEEISIWLENEIKNK